MGLESGMNADSASAFVEKQPILLRKVESSQVVRHIITIKQQCVKAQHSETMCGQQQQQEQERSIALVY